MFYELSTAVDDIFFNSNQKTTVHDKSKRPLHHKNSMLINILKFNYIFYCTTYYKRGWTIKVKFTRRVSN